jgi:hypothetical protein
MMMTMMMTMPFLFPPHSHSHSAAESLAPPKHQHQPRCLDHRGLQGGQRWGGLHGPESPSSMRPSTPSGRHVDRVPRTRLPLLPREAVDHAERGPIPHEVRTRGWAWGWVIGPVLGRMI